MKKNDHAINVLIMQILTICPNGFLNPFQGGRRVFRQTEIARKMVGKAEIIQNQRQTAVEIGILPIENSITTVKPV